jgi:iron-sulfur cluster assembly accessory protein
VIILTDKAESKLKQLLVEQGSSVTGVRFAVSGGGCSGYQYGLTFDTAKETDTVQDNNGLKVYIDPETEVFVQGLVVDYLDTLEDAGFSITNPAAKSSCGCGKSFSV